MSFTILFEGVRKSSEITISINCTAEHAENVEDRIGLKTLRPIASSHLNDHFPLPHRDDLASFTIKRPCKFAPFLQVVEKQCQRSHL